MSQSSAKRRNRPGSQASLGMSMNDDMEMSEKGRPQSSHSRNAWSDDDLLTGQGGDDIDFTSPRAPASAAVDVIPSAMEAEPVSHQKRVPADVRAPGAKNVPVGCWTRFKRIVRGLWRTRQTEDTDSDREMHIKTTLRELIIYMVFITILCILTFGMTSSTMYYFTKVMRDLFVESSMSNRNTFKDITTMQEFWMYVNGPLSDGLYWEQYYNNVNVSNDDMGYIYFENKVLGMPRIRQVRVRNDSCEVHSDFKSVIKECYAPYSESSEDTSPFGKMNGSAWEYKDQKILQSRSYWGRMATYAGGGFTQLLAKKKDKTKEIFADLKQNLWLNRGTRAVFIDFSVYNANINLFCIVRLLFEYPPTGGCIPSFNFRTLKLIRYVTAMDHFVMACEGLFIIFIIYYTIEEILEIKKHKMQYFKSFWNILDVVVIMLGYVAILFNLYRFVVVGELLSSLLENSNQYANFDNLGFWQTQFNNMVAVAVFFAWIKVFKYISFNKTMNQLSSTLSKCAKDVAGFAIMFFIIFFAYAQLGYLIFGTQVRDFSTFQDSIFTLFRIILGDFDFHQIENANRVLGPTFFITYVFFVFFVLLNMFLAIINDTYAEVKSDIASQESEFEITDYFKKGYQNVLNKLSFKREKIIDIQKALKSADVNQDNKLDFEEWRQTLKSRGHADAEIEAVFARYDLDGDRILDEDEQRRMQEDLEGQKAELNEEIEEMERKKDNRPKSGSRVSFRGSDAESDDDDDESGGLSGRAGSATGHRRGGGGGVSYEEFNVLSRRVDRMEHSIGSIVSKIDAVLVKLEAMEKAKLKRRETMAKLLDSITENEKSGRSDDDLKRDQMEKLVREELERWDSEASMTRPDSRGPSPSASRVNTAKSGRSTARGSTQSSAGSVRVPVNEEPPRPPFGEHTNV
ncbi:polycystic kidney disease 2-like 1 protein [Exaiptasia diaphana]|uniref:EF-hand domain-containing protein n=1 Tax=Exaiptasia diaphana TaxID=2652724 RepID=A0A913XZF1_EXADI|nr:polycystic kidney disease 2-like 1 protein [Exaiptasia diaphana]KXJ23969.1 Polycystin-2 [Exaiptasia diaphana]